MGEVYRARDTKLNRDVAIKVLPESVARDSERLARFRREAQVLASLNHPHIAAIYGLESSDGVDALVLELVEGETLAERIAQGPLQVDEALEIARQIAMALEAAHEKGIVHRDLKPANVKLDPSGRVKVLDFGLAKALSIDGSSPDITSSPTLTAASTQAGVVIGTAAYMSPEQARGKGVDKRADIWAFGAVLYEMLSGRKAFEGETVSDTLAAVLMKEPDWSRLPGETPASVRRVLRRCLDRDPKTRIHDIADARLELDEPLPPSGPVPIPYPNVRVPVWAWIAGLILALAAGVAWWLALRPRTAPAPMRVGYAVELPEGEQVPYDDSLVMDVSRDGTRIVFVGERDGRRRLYIRSRDRIETAPVSGSEGAYSPFFSPDAQWVGFFADGKLKKVPAAGGVAMVLADAVNNRGGVWLDDDTIVFAPHFTSGLNRVRAVGGKTEVLTAPDAKAGERTHRWPTWLPGNAGVLFTIGLLKGPGNYDDAKIAVWDPKTRRTRVLFQGGSMARFAPPDHLLFWRSLTTMAVRFDPGRVAVSGEPGPLPERVGGDPSSGVAYAALAADGTFAFVPAGETNAERTLILTDRGGKARTVPAPPRAYMYPRFSPDGKRIAVSIGPGHGNADDVWICDIDTGALTRLTFGDGNGNYYAVWSPDGKRLAYTSDRAHQGIWFKNADGSGEEEPLHPDARPQLPQDWSRDGSRLVINQGFPVSDTLLVSLSDRKDVPFEPLAFAAVLSPDGDWIAYNAQSSATSPPQTFVRPVSGTGGKSQIGSEFGTFPVWTDREIVYLSENKQVVAVEVTTKPAFRAGPPRELFEFRYDRGSGPLRSYDVTRDGQTFVFVGGASPRAWRHIDVMTDWSARLGKTGS